jgi:hypothetical protein
MDFFDDAPARPRVGLRARFISAIVRQKRDADRNEALGEDVTFVTMR